MCVLWELVTTLTNWDDVVVDSAPFVGCAMREETQGCVCEMGQILATKWNWLHMCFDYVMSVSRSSSGIPL